MVSKTWFRRTAIASVGKMKYLERKIRADK